MKNAIILHAMEDSPKHHWYPWLKKQLEERGYEVNVPQLPDTNNPQLSKWIPFIFDNCKFNKDTVLVGHSAGGAAIWAVLEELKTPIKQAISVAGFSYYPGGDGIVKPSYDWVKIKSSAKEIVIINSDDDPYGHNDIRGRVAFEMLDMENSIQIILKRQDHMSVAKNDTKYKEFPLLLRLIG